MTLVDLPVFGRPARLVWRKHRWVAASRRAGRAWTGEDPEIASPRLAMTDRAGAVGDACRWAATAAP